MEYCNDGNKFFKEDSMKKLFIPCFGLLAAFALAFIFTACDNNSKGGDPVLTGTVTIEIDGMGDGVLRVGDTVTAVVTDSNANLYDYQWQKKVGPEGTYSNIEETGETFVVDVDVNDYIRVIVTAYGFSGKITNPAIRVRAAEAPTPVVTGVAITADTTDSPITVDRGEGLQFSATVTGRHLEEEDMEVTWSVIGVAENGEPPELSYETYITGDGYLNVGSYERTATLSVTATSKTNTSVTSDPIVVIVPQPPMYTITFIPNGGTMNFDETLEMEEGDTLYLYSWRGGWYFEVYDKVGFMFDGWSDGETEYDGTDEDLWNIIVTGDITLTARWVTGIMVTFDLDGGSGWFDNPITLRDGEVYNLWQTPTKNGVVFSGWYDISDPSETLLYQITATEDITLKATYVTGVVVTLNMDGGQLVDWSGTPQPTSYRMLPGSIFPHYSTGPSGTPEKEGYVFVGWYIEGDEDTIIDDANAIQVDTDITLKAKWGQGYIVTFDPTEGEIDEYSNTTLTVGETLDLTHWEVPRPTRDGYLFAGWRLLDGTPVSGEIPVDADITLYATWVDESVIGVYANGITAAYLLTSSWSGLDGFFFNNTTVRPITWSASTIENRPLTINSNSINVSGATYTKVTSKKTPGYNAGVSGTWSNGTVWLALDQYSTDGNASLRDEDWNSVTLAYVVEGSTLYLVLDNSYYDEDSNIIRLASEIVWSFPLVGGGLGENWEKTSEPGWD
jgi:uncharacterized repeat protein (TIGR02543 family)